jgi:hypothetical protein
MPCPELIRNPNLGGHFNDRRFRTLHHDGRRLISHWFERAWNRRDCEPAESFEPFIFCWIAFNGWAACCTELDQDRQWLDALTGSTEICDAFDKMLAASDEIRDIAVKFRSCWPIFKAQELRRLHVLTFWNGNRSRTIEHYLHGGAKQLAPECWLRHNEAQEEIPLDFPHTAAALYRVRCNLFHGDKIPHSEIDRTFVWTGFRLLAEFLNCWGLLR